MNRTRVCLLLTVWCCLAATPVISAPADATASRTLAPWSLPPDTPGWYRALAGDATRPHLRLGALVQACLEQNLALRAAHQRAAVGEAAVAVAEGAYGPRLEAAANSRHERDITAVMIEAQSIDHQHYESSLIWRSRSNTEYSLTAAARRVEARNLRANNLLPQFDPLRETTLTLGILKPLLRLGGNDAGQGTIDAAAHGSTALAAQLEHSRGEAVARIEYAYWRLAQAEQAELLHRRAVARTEQLVRERAAAVARGAAASLELLSAQENLTEQRALLLRAAHARADAAELLLFDAFGAAPRPGDTEGARFATLPVAFSIPALPPETDDVAAALARRHDVLAARAACEQQALALTLAENAALPELNLYGNVGVGRFYNARDITYRIIGQEITYTRDNNTTLDIQPWEVGMTFVMPLGTSADDARARQAALEADAGRLALSEAEARAGLEVRQARRAVETGTARLQLAEQALAQAGTQFDTVWAAYTLGQADIRQVLGYGDNHDRAFLAMLEARHDLACAITGYFRATGTLLQRYVAAGE